MAYKFDKLDVWKMALDYTDAIYDIADRLPRSEDFNLKSQMRRAGTSIGLNIAEGSTSQSDGEQTRFLGYAIRSLLETVACLHLIKRRNFLSDATPLRDAYTESEQLFASLQAFKSAIKPNRVHEESQNYHAGNPF